MKHSATYRARRQRQRQRRKYHASIRRAAETRDTARRTR